MARTLLGILAGVAAMWCVVFALEFASHALYPPPAGLNPQNPDDLNTIVAASPAGAMAMLVAGWLAGAFAGGWIAARIARAHPRIAAVTVALLVMAGVAGMIVLVPQHPHWVSALGLLLPIPCALLAARLARPRTTADVSAPRARP